jgi:two-component system cell cycle response regulator
MTCVALMRLPATEVYMVRSFMDVVSARGLAYKLADNTEQSSHAELFIIDADNQTAMTLWQALRQQRRNVIGILVSKTAVDDGQIRIQRPLNSMKLLTALGKADMCLNPKGNPNRSKAPVVTGNLHGARVLVIDDSATVRKQLELALGEQGVQVFVADSGEAGLHALSQNNIDLVFLDVMLPGADGYQICKTIKKNRQKNTVPVIMLTSKSSPFDRVKGSLAGCDSYLTKPVEFRRLIEVLDKFRVQRLASVEKTRVTMVPGTSAARAL